jgi:SAM-dependent methyltransferase
MWRLKVLVQFVLAWVPGGERLNYLMQRLRGSHAPAIAVNHALSIIRELAGLREFAKIEGCCAVEVGTGWDAAGAICLFLLGAKSVHTFDHMRHLRADLIANLLHALNSRCGEVASVTGIPETVLKRRLTLIEPNMDLEEMLKRMGIVYYAPGDATHTDLPEAGVDLLYSSDVLEHVPESVLHGIAKESARIVKPGGIGFHHIAMGDHYATAKNGLSLCHFLKYPQWLWNFFVQNSISYHNRLRERHFIDAFRASGAEVKVIDHVVHPRDLEAVRSLKVDKRFSEMTPEELAVSNSMLAIFYPAHAASRDAAGRVGGLQ